MSLKDAVSKFVDSIETPGHRQLPHRAGGPGGPQGDDRSHLAAVESAQAGRAAFVKMFSGLVPLPSAK